LIDWYFNAREDVYGPYSSKEQATEELKKFIQYCIDTGNAGGRSKPEAHRLSIVPKESQELTQPHSHEKEGGK
jgi:hypothetical protein